MKLITKISRYYLLNSVLVFIVAFVGIYISLNWILTNEIDERLELKNEEVVRSFNSGGLINNPPYVELSKVDTLFKSSGSITDTIVYIKSEKENEPFHQIVSSLTKDGKYYKLIVRTSLIEKEDLFITLLIIFAVTFGVFTLILFFINRKSAKEIFTPFHNDLENLKNYSVKSGLPVKLSDSKIDEFKELNSALASLSEKAVHEYRALKEFSEDLSHELQTLVAVIKSKLELLLQNSQLDEVSIVNLHTAYQNLGRLDKLNRSLILLARLENKDLFDSEEISINDLLNRIIDNYRDIAESKKINIISKLNSDTRIKCNLSLFETMVNNLISNSIKHNIENGVVEINLSDNFFLIQNTGEPVKVNTIDLFNRFSGSKNKSDSTGLGLAIVKKICELYEFRIEYEYEEGLHKIHIYLN
jgi:signal transduction histidine kinase